MEELIILVQKISDQLKRQLGIVEAVIELPQIFYYILLGTNTNKANNYQFMTGGG